MEIEGMKSVEKKRKSMAKSEHQSSYVSELIIKKSTEQLNLGFNFREG